MLPTPKLRNDTVSGNPAHRNPSARGTPGSGYGHPRLGMAHRGENQLHRGHEHRQRRKPWWKPRWMHERELEELEAEQMMMLQMGGLSMGGYGGNMGMSPDMGMSTDMGDSGGDESADSGSDLDLPSDASSDFQNQLSGPPDLAGQHDPNHKHHKRKRSADDAMQGRGPSAQNGSQQSQQSQQSQDEGINGNQSSGSSTQAQPQSGGFSGGFSGQSPVSQSAMNQAMQANTYKKPSGMDQGALQSSDSAISQDVAQAGPYDDMSTGYEQTSVNQASPYNASTDDTYTSLSDPSYQPNPWGYGSG